MSDASCDPPLAPIADPLLDPSSLAQLRALDPQGGVLFLQRVLSTYLRSLNSQRLLLLESGARADWPALSQTAHALKSASASVGALALSRLCARLEEAVRERQYDALPTLVNDFDAESLRVRSAVQRELGLEGAA
jgi:HPt (histidine-containing phosphotransfer) domain-containing protein